MRIWRVYVDNSVMSGMFDTHIPERVAHMRVFWQAVLDGKFQIIVSDVLEDEVEKAPKHVRDFFDALPEPCIERVLSTKDSDNLAAQYICASVITDNHLNDCKHVAIATLTRADVVVSWNCRDMLNPNRIPKYSEVNETLGYNTSQGYVKLEILTPDKFMEVHHDKT